jgi:hypothetical protein
VFNAALVSETSGSVYALVKDMNLALLAAMADAIEWPDVSFMQGWMQGFPIVGAIPDSYLFRPCIRDATLSLGATFSPASNGKWSKDIRRSIKRFADNPENRDYLEALEAVTRTEARKGYVIGPLSRTDVEARFSRCTLRPMRRFGVWQGIDDGRKMRAIDNAAANGANDASSFVETIVCIRVAWIAFVCSLFRKSCISAGMINTVALQLGLDDMAAAYRRVPTSQPQYTVFALWSMARKQIVYYYLHGHCFGHRAAVLNFNRFPHLMVALARGLFAVAVDHYFDDYIIIDSKQGGESAQDAVAGVHALVGQAVEMKKRKPMAPANIALGIYADVSAAHTAGVVSFSPIESRVQQILTMLRDAEAKNRLDPGTAASLLGKLGFLLSACFSKFGRAPCQPLVQRQYFEEATTFTAPLVAMKEFFEFVLPNMPPARTPLYTSTIPPIVVYTDAMYTPGSSPRYSRLGWCIFDPLAAHPLHGWVVVPQHVYSSLAPNLQTYITQTEALAACCPYWSAPGSFRGRQVIHLIDNTSALAGFVHGYASKPDMARLVNIFHLTQFSLDMHVWFEWVPSLCNVADLPSRGTTEDWNEFFEIAPDSQLTQTVIPPFHDWLQPMRRLLEFGRSATRRVSQRV